MTHICVSDLTNIGSDNGLSPGRRQAITWTNDGILLIRTLGTNFSEILSETHSFSFWKMHLKMSSAKWRLFCLGLNELKGSPGVLCIVVGFVASKLGLSGNSFFFLLLYVRLQIFGDEPHARYWYHSDKKQIDLNIFYWFLCVLQVVKNLVKVDYKTLATAWLQMFAVLNILLLSLT